MTIPLSDNLAQEMRNHINSVSLKADALKQMQELVDKADDLEKRLDGAQQSLKVRTKKCDELEREVANHKAARSALDQWQAKLEEREKAITNLEKEAAVAQAESVTYGKCFNLIFRNTTIKENVTRSVPDGYMTTQTALEETTREPE